MMTAMHPVDALRPPPAPARTPPPGCPHPAAGKGPPGRLTLALLLLLPFGSIVCSETGVASHWATIILRNDIQDPALYGPAGTIEVYIDALDLGPRGVSGGERVAQLRPALREISFEAPLGIHSVLLVSTDPEDGSTVYRNRIGYDIMADGAFIEIRVTGDGSLCFIGGDLDGVPCQDA